MSVKEIAKKEIREVWEFIKMFLIVSGVILWIFVVVIKLHQ